MVANINKDDVMFDLPRKFTRNAIPADRCEIPGSPVIRKMAHLKNISTEITCYMADDEVGMLIRQNCTNTLRPREIIYGEESDPNAVRSLLGWYVNGPLHFATDWQDYMQKNQWWSKGQSNDPSGICTLVVNGEGGDNPTGS